MNSTTSTSECSESTLVKWKNILTSSSSATRDSLRAVGNTRDVKLILIVPADRGAGKDSSFNFPENIFSELQAAKIEAEQQKKANLFFHFLLSPIIFSSRPNLEFYKVEVHLKFFCFVS